MTVRTAAAGLVLSLVAACSLDGPRQAQATSPASTADCRGLGCFAVGTLAEEAKDPVAADYYLQAVKQDPYNPRLLTKAFSASLIEGRFDDSILLARRLTALDQPSYVPQMLLVLQAMRKQDWDRAEQLLEDVYGVGFETLITPVLGAWIHAAQGEKQAALQRLDALGRNRALSATADLHRAFVLDFLRDERAAEVAFRQILDQRRMSSYWPVVGLADLLVRRGRRGEALALYDRYLSDDPGNAFLQDRRTLAARGRTAPRLFDRPIGAAAFAFVRIANEFFQRRANRTALVYARLGSFLARDYDEALLLIGNLLRSEERYASALAAFADVPPHSDSYQTALFLRAWTLQADDRNADATQLMERFLAEQDAAAPVQAHTILADLYRDAERFDEAIAHYSSAIDKERSPAQLWYLYFARGVSYEQSDRWDQAEADFKASLAEDPNQAQVLNYLGYSWIDRGENLEEGFKLIEKAIELSPDSGFIKDSLGWAYYLQGDYERAVILLEEAILLEPGDPTINDHLGDAYWRVGRRREARFQWTHALAADPEPDLRARLEAKLDDGLERVDTALNP